MSHPMSTTRASVSAPKLRILLADDHEAVRTGLRVILDAQQDMEVVGEAADGRAALRLVESLRPDVVVMDVSMPEMNGMKATELIVSGFPRVKVLPLTRHTDSGYIEQLLRAGASGYVLKQSRSEEVVRAVRAIAAGGTYLDPAIADRALTGLQRGRDGTLGTRSKLSAREADVLRMVASGYSNKEIAARLILSVKTVESHKANAMTKLGTRSRIDIVRYALLQGWLDDV